MKNFIELTTDSSIVLINCNHIVTVDGDDQGSRVCLVEGEVKYVLVSETYDVVKALISEAIR